ncbi:G5 domain-containing protein [Cellulomonas sp. PhB143]|uniref:aggregation-promoting factor C-terminal-like domain-containing protein n=1 Tax=Cellulomonas sp. PhB143 TaxID=2485186 RepID=UPI000F481D7F|nr:G5 domain-containing protein [Cellulomonas sp. PhB143]ROS78705.1 uncharacterized protein YabE (DUF348 family) [Cellulomonas sp. PhB143]
MTPSNDATVPATERDAQPTTTSGLTAPAGPGTETRVAYRAAHTPRRPLWRRGLPLTLTATAVAVAVTGGVAYAGGAKTVSLDVDGSVTQVSTRADDVHALLAAQDVHPGTRDVVAPAPASQLEDGADVVVRTAKKVTVQAGGKNEDVWTTATDADHALDTLSARTGGDVSLVASRSSSGGRTALSIPLDTTAPVEVVADGKARTVSDGSVDVKDALADAGVKVDDDDRVVVERADEKAAAKAAAKAKATDAKATDAKATDAKAADAVATTDAKAAEAVATTDAKAADAKATDAKASEAAPAVSVVVQRVDVKDESSTRSVEHETKTVSDPDRYTDQSPVVTKDGKDGKVTTVETVTRVDGKVTDRKKVSSKVTTKPVDEVVSKGTKKRPVDTPTANEALGRSMAASRGWGGSEADCLDNLWTRESGWSTHAANPSSSAYGIPQSLPGSKMASAGSDWSSNPATQIAWGLDYIASSYGSPCGAWAHSQANGWY